MPLFATPFQFGTKAETLQLLTPLISRCTIPTFHYFTLEEWYAAQEVVIARLQSQFFDGTVIIRSSAAGEDKAIRSLAGVYDSVPDVFASERPALIAAVEQVIASYAGSDSGLGRGHQILVQQMVQDVSMSGVIFTQDLTTGAPYYVINYDDKTGRTDTVTAGAVLSNRTLSIARHAVAELQSERFSVLLSVVQELEQITGHDALDIEFAVDKNYKVHLFQVRQISTQPHWNRGITLKVSDVIDRIKSYVVYQQQEIPGLYGSRSIFGTMPDWNPAEMIGTAPRPLALSLYRYLITDYAWREARRQMGYHDPRGTRLMAVLAGKPYIDTRLSFNSFLPRDLDSTIANKLVNAWLDRLCAHKELHDKIEFEVAITALTFDFDELVAQHIPQILSLQELATYRAELFTLTANLIEGKVSPISGELQKIKMLADRRFDLLRNYRNPNLTMVSGLLEDCITLGTVPFSILARHAFIATSFIRSLVKRGVLSPQEADLFKGSIKTVATELVDDTNRFLDGTLGRAGFMEKYGHLRPGTYDIISKRYDQRDDLLAGAITRIPAPRSAIQDFHFSDVQLSQIDALLKEFGYSVDPSAFIQYMKDAIAAREYGKFVFTKNVSDSLEIIGIWGEKIGLSREELSYIRIGDLLDTLHCAEGRTLEQHLRDLSEEERARHEITRAVRLPYLIERPEDISIVPLLHHTPNFITEKTARAPHVVLDGKNDEVMDLQGKIILIESADPGFDWIFSRPIVGLVTKYGGANSHMAIRCAEFGLPAAIGCGEQIFDRLLRSGAISLNCFEKRIDPIEL